MTWPQLPGGARARSSWRPGFVGIGVGVGAGLVIARRGLGRPPPAPRARGVHAAGDERASGRWAAAVAVTAGIAEELVFRGLFLALGIGLFGLSPLSRPRSSSRVVFGLAHVYQGARGVLLAAVLGGVLAALALHTESLLPAILLHVLIDLRSLLLMPARA